MNDLHADSHPRQQRTARLRVLAGSFLGVTLLFASQRWQPPGGAPFTGPHGWAGWLAAGCGTAGTWLVPGGWLSAVMTRTGTGPLAWLATRIGVLLAWYALVGIVVHYSAQGARPTVWNIIGVTAGATAATSIGVTLGILSRPVDRRARILVSAAAGGSCAQIVIWLAERYWTYQVNYQHIRQLDWLIVLACALLAALGQVNRPTPPVYDAAGVRHVLLALAAMTTTAAVTVAGAVAWPTTQHLPSEVAVEQVPAPAGTDIALALAGIGPQGSSVLRGVSFAAFDDLSAPVTARFRITRQNGVTSPTALVLVILDPAGRPVLCGPTSPSRRTLPARVKVTVREQRSGTFTQAVLPVRWCTR